MGKWVPSNPNVVRVDVCDPPKPAKEITHFVTPFVHKKRTSQNLLLYACSNAPQRPISIASRIHNEGYNNVRWRFHAPIVTLVDVIFFFYFILFFFTSPRHSRQLMCARVTSVNMVICRRSFDDNNNCKLDATAATATTTTTTMTGADKKINTTNTLFLLSWL